MDVQWVKIRSWHVMETPTRMPNIFKTRCGRRAEGPVLDVRPGHEGTCETCLRIVAPK